MTWKRIGDRIRVIESKMKPPSKCICRFYDDGVLVEEVISPCDAEEDVIVEFHTEDGEKLGTTKRQ